MNNIKLVRSMVRETLSPFGFRVRGNNYFAIRSEAILYVNLQKSTKSSLTNPILTVNLGVYSTVLAKISGERDFPLGVSECHWNMRVGNYCNPPGDKWWDLRTEGQHHEAACEIREILETYAVPEMMSLSNLEALVHLWKSGRCPGLTAYQRDQYLKEIQASGIQ